MGWRGTTVLILLVVAVGGYLWLEDVPNEGADIGPIGAGQPRAAPTDAQPILDFEPADVIGVRLVQDGEVRSASREHGRWRGARDSSVIDDFLDNLTGLGRLMEIPTQPGELKDYGLEPPRAHLALQLRDRAATLVLQIGDPNPAGTGVYVRLGDQGPVVLGGALVTWEFDKAFRAMGGPPGGQ